jgi:DNA repair protein RecO (recombination protein O)
MLNKTRAIVLHKTNYAESSIVVQVYSLDYGKISLLIHGVKRKKSRIKSALFEPLSILEFVGNVKNTDKLVIPREVKLHLPLISIQTDISKRLIALFLSEIIHKSIKEPTPEKSLYLFIENALQVLEVTTENVANFHLVFLMELTKYLGFYPMKSEGEYFNMLDGYSSNVIPNSNEYLQGEQKGHFLSLLGMKIANSASLKLRAEDRKMVLESLIKYYQVHIPAMGEVKSHYVLETIFN